MATVATPSLPEDLVSVEPDGVELAADWETLRSPETYVGYARSTGLASPGGVERDRRHLYLEPAHLELNQWAFSGDWTVSEEVATLNEPGGRIIFRFHGRDLNLVLGSEGPEPAQFLVLIDDAPPKPQPRDQRRRTWQRHDRRGPAVPVDSPG